MPSTQGLRDLNLLTKPVGAPRLPQDQIGKNMLETVTRWSIRSTKDWPTPSSALSRNQDPDRTSGS